ncbi:MAG: hypothetical protein VZR05_06630, partial [Lachnospiraceae bacterium]|nr:hypothetical protein [Lachnospiraceae bacterium]
VTIYREISSTGKNICRICGIITPLNLLRELGLLLMDIHGQHEHRFLMDPDMHLSFLDRMGDSAYQAQLKKTEEACEAFLEAHRQYARLKKENDRKQQRMETLEKSLQELHAAKLVNGEEESLQAEALKLRNEEKITAVLRSARESLSVGETEGSALEKIKAAAKAMESLSAYGDQMKHLGARCENAYYELEEISYALYDD